MIVWNIDPEIVLKIQPIIENISTNMVKFMDLAMPLLNILGCDFTETDFILILIQFDTEIFFLIKRSGPNCLVDLKYSYCYSN